MDNLAGAVRIEREFLLGVGATRHERDHDEAKGKSPDKSDFLVHDGSKEPNPDASNYNFGAIREWIERGESFFQYLAGWFIVSPT